MSIRFTLHEVYSSEKTVSDSELKRLEMYLDKIWGVLKIDVEFTRHFKERMRDPRNKKHITLGELSKIFSKLLIPNLVNQ